MKGLPTLIRVHQWRLEEKRKIYSELEGLRDAFVREIAELEAQLLRDQKAASYSPEIAQTYGSYAFAVIERRNILNQSIAEADEKVAEASIEVHEAFQEVKRYETALERLQERLRKEEERRDQIEQDEIGLNMFRWKEASEKTSG